MEQWAAAGEGAPRGRGGASTRCGLGLKQLSWSRLMQRHFCLIWIISLLVSVGLTATSSGTSASKPVQQMVQHMGCLNAAPASTAPRCHAIAVAATFRTFCRPPTRRALRFQNGRLRRRSRAWRQGPMPARRRRTTRRSARSPTPPRWRGPLIQSAFPCLPPLLLAGRCRVYSLHKRAACMKMTGLAMVRWAVLGFDSYFHRNA